MHFAVWAPNAQRVSVVGDFNDWDGRRHQMRHRKDVGVWEIFIPDIDRRTYKFEVIDACGLLLPLAIPSPSIAKVRPGASLTPFAHDWEDQAHQHRGPVLMPSQNKTQSMPDRGGPQDENGWICWMDRMAEQLIPYAAEMGFTHIEFMPISEHPFDPSWGYQTIGLFAPSSRFGEPEGFARFVEGAHRAGLGVLISRCRAFYCRRACGGANTTAPRSMNRTRGCCPDWNTPSLFGRRDLIA